VMLKGSLIAKIAVYGSFLLTLWSCSGKDTRTIESSLPKPLQTNTDKTIAAYIENYTEEFQNIQNSIDDYQTLDVKNFPKEYMDYQEKNGQYWGEYFSITIPKTAHILNMRVADGILIKFDGHDSYYYLMSPFSKRSSAYLDISFANFYLTNSNISAYLSKAELSQYYGAIEFKFPMTKDGYARYVNIGFGTGYRVGVLITKEDVERQKEVMKEIGRMLESLRQYADGKVE